MLRVLNMIAISLAEALATATKGLGTMTSEAFMSGDWSRWVDVMPADTALYFPLPTSHFSLLPPSICSPRPRFQAHERRAGGHVAFFSIASHLAHPEGGALLHPGPH